MAGAYRVHRDAELGEVWACRRCGRCYTSAPLNPTLSCTACRFEPMPERSGCSPALAVVSAVLSLGIGAIILLSARAIWAERARAAAALPPPPAPSSRPLIEDPQ